MVDVYVAGLISSTVVDPATIISFGFRQAMVLRFVRDVDRGDIVKAWKRASRHNATVKLATIRR